jgi:hypothetical protein
LGVFLPCVISGQVLAQLGGAVLIDGNDPEEHGGFESGANVRGWLYIQDGFDLVGGQVGNEGTVAVCLGCKDAAAWPTTDVLDAFAYGFDYSGLPGAGWTREVVAGPEAIAAFFADQGDTRISEAGIIYMPSEGGGWRGGITQEELAVANANAQAIKDFVAGGGGLFSHGHQRSEHGFLWAGDAENPPGWLKVLMPDLCVAIVNPWDCSGGTKTVLRLTPDSCWALATLANADFPVQPWHAYFIGDLGGLKPLVVSALGDVVVIGGPVTLPPASPDCNNNGIRDDLDICSGTSLDLDENGVPDECETTRIYVKAGSSGAGTSWADAFGDLQSALDLALDYQELSPPQPVEIWVAAGTYKPGTSAGDSFLLVDNAPIYGGFVGTETSRDQRNPDPATNNTVLSGDLGGGVHSYHVVRIELAKDEATVLDGFTITQGDADGSGSGEWDAYGAGVYSLWPHRGRDRC